MTTGSQKPRTCNDRAGHFDIAPFDLGVIGHYGPHDVYRVWAENDCIRAANPDRVRPLDHHSSVDLLLTLPEELLPKVAILLLIQKALEVNGAPDWPDLDARILLVRPPLVKPLLLLQTHVDWQTERPRFCLEVLVCAYSSEGVANLSFLGITNRFRKELHLIHVNTGRICQTTFVRVNSAVTTNDPNSFNFWTLGSDEVNC